MVQNILVGGGGYGLSNKGDDAILVSMVEMLKEIFPKARIRVMLKNPDLANKLKVDHCSTKRYSAWIYMYMSDLFICGGGNIIQETNDPIYRGYPSTQITLLTFASIFQVRSILFSAGVEEIHNPINKYLLNKTIEKVDVISVRDQGSKKKLKRDIGIDSKISLIVDPAFFLIPNKLHAKEILNNKGLERQDFIVINILEERGSIKKNYKKEIAKFLSCKEVANTKVLFLPNETRLDKDKKAIKDVINLSNHKNYTILDCEKFTPEVISGVIGFSLGIISMRMHPLIFAVSQNVPIIPIIWKSNKNKMVEFSYEYALEFQYANKLNYKLLLKQFSNVILNDKKISFKEEKKDYIASVKNILTKKS